MRSHIDRLIEEKDSNCPDCGSETVFRINRTEMGIPIGDEYCNNCDKSVNQTNMS